MKAAEAAAEARDAAKLAEEEDALNAWTATVLPQFEVELVLQDEQLVFVPSAETFQVGPAGICRHNWA